MAQAEAALSAGWKVSVVAKRLCPSLQGRVDWIKLFVPKRLFAFQWLSARYFIRKAIGDASRFDVIHGHQPQIADLCHVFQCHFLTRAAHVRNCLLDAKGMRRQAEWLQKYAVLLAEDRCYGKWNPQTHMLFNSGLTRDAFTQFYSLPASQEILVYPSPPWDPVIVEERMESRRVYQLDGQDFVLGFLGGMHERKGYKLLLDALRSEVKIKLLFGGLHADGLDNNPLGNRLTNAGLVDDTRKFYAACDALVVCSHFEPFGYVVSEAAARGIPTIATDSVGALPHILEHKAGLRWPTGQPIRPLADQISKKRDEFRGGCKRFTREHSREGHDARLMELYQSVANAKAPGCV